MASSITLKSVLLSWYTFVHVQSLESCIAGLSTWAEMVGLPKDSVSDSDKDSPRQNHMLGCLRGFNAAYLFICGMAWTQPTDSYIRNQLLTAEGIMFAVTALDAYKLGITKFLPAYVAPALLSGCALARDFWKPTA